MTIKRKRKNAFLGQAEAAELTTWLNGDRPEYRKEALMRARIGHLIEDMNNSAQLFLAGRRDDKLVAHIDKELSRYKLWVETKQVVPTLSGTKTFAEPAWWFGWHSNAGDLIAMAIMAIVRLGNRGLLGRVRICERCKRWFYANYNHRRFCQEECRIRDYQTSEVFKVRRRARYRQL
jgi:hypothetical protein